MLDSFFFLFLISLNVGLLTEIRMLRWMSCNIRKDSIRYEDICLKIRMALIDKKDERESCLKWFAHMQVEVINALVRKSELIQVK